MPYVKSIPVRTTVNKTLSYILDPDKTDQLMYTASMNCMTSARDAYLEMKCVFETFSTEKYNAPLPLEGKGSVKAIHYIQSFDPKDNISPELAHRIGKAFARKTFGDDCQVVIATHIDKGHVHNHIIVNTYTMNGRKFNDNQATLKHVREYSDRVCLAFGIQPFDKRKGKGKTVAYNEWENKKRGTSWKQKIQLEIDNLIVHVKSIDELLYELELKGYEVKRGKYISLKAPGQQRAVRLEKLGDVYSLESLDGWIKSELRNAYQSVIGQIPESITEVQMLSAQLAVINRDRLHSIGEIEAKIDQFRSDFENNTEARHKYMVYSDITKTYYEISQGDYISRLVKEKQQEEERAKVAAKRGSR